MVYCRGPRLCLVGFWLLLSLGCGGSSATSASDAADLVSPDTTVGDLVFADTYSDVAVDGLSPADGQGDGLSTSDSVGGLSGVRDTRYCEVLLIFLIEAKLHVEVYNSYGLGDCPAEAWNALDSEALKTENNAVAVLLNGPRYWLMNSIRGDIGGTPTIKTFGTLPMFLAATIELDPSSISDNTPYTERLINRTTEFVFDAGETVYQLTSPEGGRYTMQSYALYVDPTLKEADLAGLKSRLSLPSGWDYVAVKLDAELVLKDVGATVVQDELGNTYTKHHAP